MKGGKEMPRRDGTGPDGKGPNTGRGRGPCKKGGAPKKRSTRRGTGRGRRNRGK